MSDTPTGSAPPLAFIALGALLLLAVGGAAFGALSGGEASATPSPTTSLATVTPSPTPLVVGGGSAWPAETPTAVPTATPVPATPSPTATPRPADGDASLAICRDQRNGQCVDELQQVRDGGFVLIVAFEDAAAGDTFAFRVEGPDGEVVNGASIPVGGGAGRAWSTFRGGLADGDWTAIVTRNGAEVARADFAVR